MGKNKIFEKSQTYGTIIKINYKNNLITLRSKKELYFYSLLMKNNIEFLTNNLYPNSNMFYDFYLIDYDIFIEITGFMNNEEYRNKMLLKRKLYNSVLLNNKKEMKNFINKIKNENFKN